MFLRSYKLKLVNNAKIFIKSQKQLSRRFYFDRTQINSRLQKGISLVFGIGCSLTVFSALGFAYNQSQVEEPEKNGDESTQDVSKKKSWCSVRDRTHRKSLKKSILQLEQAKEEFGSPGLVCAVSIDGNVVLKTGMGFADVENGVKCSSDTKMRIASISKALTSIAIAKLMEEGKIDLDAPIQKYVKYFPEKTFDNEAVTITTRQLMSHTGGIRHYEKSLPENEEQKSEGEKEKEGTSSKKPKKISEFEHKEYHIKDHYKTTQDAIKLFQDDPLLKKPGTDYLYSTHAWTLLSAVVEGSCGADYVSYMKNLCYDIGLENTFPEFNDPLIYNRSRNYSRDKKGRLQNSPYVDNSYKFAGGGFMSNVDDLLKIGNTMLYCHAGNGEQRNTKGYLSKETVDLLWTIVPETKGKVYKKSKDIGYGLGWTIQPKSSEFECGGSAKFAAMHGGAAVGASSFLLIIPEAQETQGNSNSERALDKPRDSERTLDKPRDSEGTTDKPRDNGRTLDKPRGIVIAIMVNMEGVGLSQTAIQIAKNFDIDQGCVP